MPYLLTAHQSLLQQTPKDRVGEVVLLTARKVALQPQLAGDFTVDQSILMLRQQRKDRLLDLLAACGGLGSMFTGHVCRYPLIRSRGCPLATPPLSSATWG